MGKKQPLAIRRISVKDLFGQFTYDIPDNEIEDSSRLLILYGDNGSGKTKILQLLYHLLSPADDKGHRSFLSRIPFREFSVYLTNNNKITLLRTNKKLIGNYTLSIHEYDKQIIKSDIITRDGGVDSRKTSTEKYCSLISKLGFTVYYLSDQREFQSDELFFPDIANLHLSEYEDIKLKILNESNIYRDLSRTRRTSSDIETIRNRDLELAIRRIEDWLNRTVKQSLSKGEISVNKIYAEIIKSISTKIDDEDLDKKIDLDELTSDFIKLANRSKKYDSFKMTSPIDIESILNSIKNAPKASYPTLKKVFQPYIESLDARFKALEDVYKIINTFIEGLNAFYLNKTVEFDFREGILKIMIGKKRLDSKNLSSGEKQLLLLFCNVFLARDKPSIFLIDEPEISLNIKWQRKLVKALLNLTEGSHVQFILATHSAELLTQYSDNVVHLKMRNR